MNSAAMGRSVCGNCLKEKQMGNVQLSLGSCQLPSLSRMQKLATNKHPWLQHVKICSAAAVTVNVAMKCIKTFRSWDTSLTRRSGVSIIMQCVSDLSVIKVAPVNAMKQHSNVKLLDPQLPREWSTCSSFLRGHQPLEV